MYNNKFFGPAFKVYRRFNGTTSNSINCEASQTHNDMPTGKDLFKDLSPGMQIIEKSRTIL